jgi:hypothetical protein
MFKRMQRLIVLLFWLMGIPFSVVAQTANTATLDLPNTQNFPEITTSVKPFDGQRNYLYNLRLGDITIIEDRNSLAITALTERHPGTQFVLAISLERAFAIRDSNGISRYDRIQDSFTMWADNQPNETNDDLSIVTADGYEAVHLDNAQDWLEHLNDYDTDPRTAEPSLDVLARAIDIANDPTPQPGMGRSILFLTPAIPRESIGAIDSLISLAQQENVHINIWLVGSPAYFTTEGAAKLASMAEQTGGYFYTYSGIEVLPDIETYIEPLRHIYDLAYQSKIITPETHQITAQINTGILDITSNTVDFELSVLPPNPIFISPPLQIVRADRRDFNDSLNETEPDYSPKEQTLEVLVEFPDGFSRPLVRSTLYVDGQIEDENTAPPFEKFTWKLESYITSQEHIIQVEVLDSLGLSNLTIETPVQITVQQTPQSVLISVARNGPLIAGALVAISGAILLLVLIIGGRIRPRAFAKRNGNGKISSLRQQRAANSDPVTQPVKVKSEPRHNRFASWVNRLSWPQRRSGTEAPAYLEPLDTINANDPLNRIPLTKQETTIGRNPTQATIVMDDSSIADLHARLYPSENGLFLIKDEGSVAGSWVNYEPVTPEGTLLQHGDIIHIGRIRLCISYANSNHIPKLKVLDLEETQL